MKNLLLTLFFLSLSAHAQIAPAQNLKQNMKSLGGLFKQLSADVNDPAKNAESATNAGKMIALFTPTLSQIPDAVAALPADQQEAATTEYKRIIQQQIKDASALRDAFLANDNVGASTLIQRMSADRKDGHAKFRN